MGGVSSTTASYMADAAARKLAIAAESMSWLGLGGSCPAGMTWRPAGPQTWTTSSMVASPTSTVDRPAAPSMPTIRATDGRRRSASTSRTRWRFSAIAMASARAVVDLPSPGTEEVTTTTRERVDAVTNCRFVCTRR